MQSSTLVVFWLPLFMLAAPIVFAAVTTVLPGVTPGSGAAPHAASPSNGLGPEPSQHHIRDMLSLAVTRMLQTTGDLSPSATSPFGRHKRG